MYIYVTYTQLPNSNFPRTRIRMDIVTIHLGANKVHKRVHVSVLLLGRGTKISILVIHSAFFLIHGRTTVGSRSAVRTRSCNKSKKGTFIIFFAYNFLCNLNRLSFIYYFFCAYLKLVKGVQLLCSALQRNH